MPPPTDTNQSPYFLPILLLGIAALLVVEWFGACWLVAYSSGWSALARRYALPPGGEDPMRSGPGRQTFKNATLFANSGTCYNRCVDICITEEGVAIAPAGLFRALFRLGHPDLFVPWSIMGECYEKKRRGVMTLGAQADAGNGRTVPLFFMGSAGAAVRPYLRPTPDVPAASATPYGSVVQDA